MYVSQISPRYQGIWSLKPSKQMSSVAAQVLHPIFRRPGLPACEAIGRPQKYPWGFNHWCFLTEKKNQVFENPQNWTFTKQKRV